MTSDRSQESTVKTLYVMTAPAECESRLAKGLTARVSGIGRCRVTLLTIAEAIHGDPAVNSSKSCKRVEVGCCNSESHGGRVAEAEMFGSLGGTEESGRMPVL